MNPDQPSREQIEARITALLLGELPADEAELLRWTISCDAELQKLHGRLLLTVGLVREVVAHPEEASAEKAVPRKLSDERRQKLLAHFKTPRPVPKELFWLKRIEVRPLVTALVLVALVGVIAALLLPATAKSKRAAMRASANASAENLRAVDQSVAQWSLETSVHKSKGSASIPLPVALMPVPPPPQTEIVLPKPDTTPEMQAQVIGQNVSVSALAPVTLSRPVVAPPVAEMPEFAFEGRVAVPSTQSPATASAAPEPTESPAPTDAQPPPAETKTEARDQAVTTVQLQNGDPQQVAQVLQNMFGSSIVARNGTSSSQNSALQQRRVSGVTAMGTTTASIGGGGGGFGFGGGARGGANPFAAQFGGRGGGRGSSASPTPDTATLERIPADSGQNVDASSLVQDGKLLYEMGKFDEAGVKLNQALKADPNNQSAFYYLNLDKQANYAREEQNRTTQAQDNMVEVAKAWSPKAGTGLPVPNPNASTVPATPPETTLVWNNSGTDRSRTDNQLGDGWHGGALLGPVPSDGTPPPATVSEARVPGVSAAYRSDLSAPQNLGDAYRSTAGEVAVVQKSVPVLGDVPLEGRLFAGSAMAPAAAPAPSSTPVPTINLFFDDTITADSGPKNMGEDNKRLPQSGGGTLALNGANTFAGESVANAGTTVYYNLSADGVEATDKSSDLNLALAEPQQHILTGFSFNAGNSGQQQTAEVAQNTPFQQRVKLGLGLPATAEGENNKVAHGSSDLALTSGLRNNSGGAAGRTTVTVDPYHDNRVIVADAATEEQILKTISQLDSPPRQMLIDGRVVNISSTNGSVGGILIAEPAPLVTQNSFQARLASQNQAVGSLALAPTVAPSAPVATMPPQPGMVARFAFAGTNAVVLNNGTHYDGLTRDDVSGLRYLFSTNAVVLENPERQKAVQLASDQQISNGLRNPSPAMPSANPSEMITQIIPVRFVDAQEMLKKLASSISPQATIVQNEAGNSFVITDTRQNVKRLTQMVDSLDVPPRPAATNAPIPQPEFLTRENAFSTFSMNVSDVSFKLAQASLQKGQMPDPASIRSEEFINAFNYRDPEATAGQPLAFASERARDPFAHNRDFLRFSVKTAAAGRQAGRALNLVLLLDTSGSMERADRVAIIREALRVLAAQLQPQDTVSVVTFARTARLWADGVSGDKAGATLDQVGGITPDGGTNLEEAMRLAYETAHRHYLAQGANRVVLLTDGAANLGNVDPNVLKQKVEAQRRQGIALDCFGIGWEDFNDDLLEQLSGNGDGRYAFINSPDEAGAEFAAKLAGALQVAAQDVKVQVEFNPQRVISWRQIGYAKHQLTKEQFRDNTVLAAEIAAQEAGNALYTVETKPDGAGPIATVYVRYRIPGTQDVRERSWTVDGDGAVPALDQSSAAMRLAATAGAFSEWLAASQFAQEVTPDELLKDLSGVPQVFGADQRPAQLEWMIRQAQSVAGQTMPVSQPVPSARGGF